MQRFVAVFVFSLLVFQIKAQVISIVTARAQATGTVVTVRGVVTNGSELGKIRYLQDGTAGIAAFPGTGSAANFESSVTKGDLIEVTGTLVSFSNLLEISPITSYTVISSNNTQPAPVNVDLDELTDELEGQLVRITCVNFDTPGSAVTGGGTYVLADGNGNTAQVYFRTGHPMAGTILPASSVNITAILSQYGSNFQLLPRTTADLPEAACFYFTEQPDQSNIANTSFTLKWKTNKTSTTKVKYGTSPQNLAQTATGTGNVTSHTANLSGLTAGTVYWAQTLSVSDGDTLKSEIMPYTTKSQSSGQIQVYFNYPIDNQFVGNKQPSGTSPEACVNGILDHINNAQQTVDVAVYNINRPEFVEALVAAHNRGVRVRYVASESTANVALVPPPPFPVVYGNTNAIMHNKFVVIDADVTNKAWVLSGSMNWTTGNIENDNNNILWIQDQSLARGYEIEFEEMWGSDGVNPIAANQRFGSSKKNNTPHRYIVGTIPVESWFSPSDNVTDRIVEMINTANSSAEFALFSFTKNEPGNALIEKFTNENVAVRGIIDNINDVGSEYWFLKQQGIPVSAHTQSGDLHHKYAVIDAQLASSDPTVLTGSHNWSLTAETQNDENTLVIHDVDIAKLYKAEFEQRFEENPVPVQEPAIEGLQIYPNPVSDAFVIRSEEWTADQDGWIQIWTITGQLVQEQVFVSGQYIPVSQLPDGTYLVKIKGKNAFTTLSLQKISR